MISFPNMFQIIKTQSSSSMKYYRFILIMLFIFEIFAMIKLYIGSGQRNNSFNVTVDCHGRVECGTNSYKTILTVSLNNYLLLVVTVLSEFTTIFRRVMYYFIVRRTTNYQNKLRHSCQSITPLHFQYELHIILRSISYTRCLFLCQLKCASETYFMGKITVKTEQTISKMEINSTS